MDANLIATVIEKHFLPVLSQHKLVMRKRPEVEGVVNCDLYCERCGELRKLVLVTPQIQLVSRDAVEGFLQKMVDEHFRPWEKVECMKDGQLKAMVAEWLTLRIREYGAFYVKDIPAMLKGQTWSPEFVTNIARTLEFVEDAPTTYTELVRFPKEHPFYR